MDVKKLSMEELEYHIASYDKEAARTTASWATQRAETRTSEATRLVMSAANREGYAGVLSRRANRQLRRMMDQTYDAELGAYLEDAKVQFGMTGIFSAIAWYFLSKLLTELWDRWWSSNFSDYGVMDAW